MTEIETKNLIKYTKQLSLLYVEDDFDLQKQSKELFTLLFKSVAVANDGEEALKLFKNTDFDMIITDIKMPNMDGIELTKKIKEINPSQCIIVTSAYNDSEYLLKFINIGIKQFIVKPINLDSLHSALYITAKNIVNANMIEVYRKDLEFKNNELTKKSDELEKLNRILNTKLTLSATSTKNIPLSHINNSHLNELKEIEVDIEGAFSLIQLSQHINSSSFKIISSMFLSYSLILTQYEEYTKNVLQLELLADLLNNKVESFINNIENTSAILESYIYTLKIWRSHLENEDIKKAFSLCASMNQDIENLLSITKK